MLEKLIDHLRNDPADQFNGIRLSSGGISLPGRGNKKSRRRQKTLEERINSLEKELFELKTLLMEYIGGNSNTQ